MSLTRIHALIDQLRKDTIGSPQWVEAKQAFEYEDHSIEVVAILKLVRATQSLTVLNLLCENGLFLDLGATIRSVNDCVEEIFFLLETFPDKPGPKVEQFVKNFFEGTIDGYLEAQTHQVRRDKIRSASVRILKGSHDNDMQNMLETIYRTFSGYVHANYAHIMEIYNGATDEFNLGGISSSARKRDWAFHVRLAVQDVAMAAAFAAKRLNREALGLEFVNLVP